MVLGMSCLSPYPCVAAGDDGSIATSTNAAGGTKAWLASSVDPGHELEAVSCPTASLRVAADVSGRVRTRQASRPSLHQIPAMAYTSTLWMPVLTEKALVLVARATVEHARWLPTRIGGQRHD
jgi:hypothetical protein